MRLSELKIGTQAILEEYMISPLHKKLLTMGLRPGQTVRVLRKLPLHGTLYIRVDDRNLAIRHEEAAQIQVRA